MSSKPLLPNPVRPEPPFRDLTEDEWMRVARLLPEMKSTGPRRGRPHADIRQVVNGILWVLHHRKPWSAMPNTYPVHQTCHRHFLRWQENGVLATVATELFGTDTLCTDYGVRSRKITSQPRPVQALMVDWPSRP
ncbi:transposase [Paraburkholderia flava]|jgi:transposase|uniref:transposase n=1 Tax=Paraburkholderia flava TaxID=2547393 RepID=UPI00105DB745|nr:transposase [Paraburkholderia flava]